MSDVQHAHNEQVVLLHSVMKGAQTLALVSPPVVLGALLFRRTFSVSRFLRYNALSTLALGPAFGVGSGWYMLSRIPQADRASGTADRAARVESDALQVRCDDYSKIGGVLGALATTTVFLKRAPLVWNLGGGAALGVAGGVLAHLYKDYQEGVPTGAERAVDEVKTAVGKK